MAAIERRVDGALVGLDIWAAEAEARGGDLYLYGEKITPSKCSWLQPAMEMVLEKLNHRNKEGDLISLNAWRQWHVLRGNQLTPVGELRNPNQIRKRGRIVHETDLTVDELL